MVAAAAAAAVGVEVEAAVEVEVVVVAVTVQEQQQWLGGVMKCSGRRNLVGLGTIAKRRPDARRSCLSRSPEESRLHQESDAHVDDARTKSLVWFEAGSKTNTDCDDDYLHVEAVMEMTKRR